MVPASSRHRSLPVFRWRTGFTGFVGALLALVLVLFSILAATLSAAPVALAAPARHLNTLSTLHPLGGGGPPPVLTGAVSGGPDTLDVFAMTTNPYVPQQMYGAGWNGSTWSSWEAIGAADATTSPSFVTYGQNSLAVFAESQGQLQEISGAGGFPYWNHTASVLPMPTATWITSGPGATSWGGSRLDVFTWALTRFGRLAWASLLHEWSTDGGSTWQSEKLSTFSGFNGNIAPVVVSRGANDLTVLAFSTSDSLYALNWNGTSWGSWQSLGGYLPSQRIAAQPLAGNQVHVFGIGGNSALYDNTLTGSSWSGWNSLGGYLTSSPTVGSWAYDSMTVCALSSDNSLWCRDDIYGSWSGWYSLGGSFASGLPCSGCNPYYWTPITPVSAVSDLGTLDVFEQSTDLNIWHMEGSWDYYSGWSWYGWESPGHP